MDHAKVSEFDPYTVSKVLRYLLKYNDGGPEAQEIFKSFSLLLTQTIKNREASLINSDLKDPLIDLESHDVVDIVRIYATFAQPDDTLVPSFVPKLFQDSAAKAATSATVSTLFDSSMTTDLREMSIEVLKSLQGPI